MLSAKRATIIVVVGGNAELFLTVGCTSGLDLPLHQHMVALAKKLGGSGGGKPNLVPAGGIQASPIEFIQEVKSELYRPISLSKP